jgi:hypothetical protein
MKLLTLVEKNIPEIKDSFMEEKKYLEKYSSQLDRKEINMYILIENDNLGTPIVSLTPINVKDKESQSLGQINTLKFPHLEISS